MIRKALPVAVAAGLAMGGCGDANEQNPEINDHPAKANAPAVNSSDFTALDVYDIPNSEMREYMIGRNAVNKAQDGEVQKPLRLTAKIDNLGIVRRIAVLDAVEREITSFAVELVRLEDLPDDGLAIANKVDNKGKYRQPGARDVVEKAVIDDAVKKAHRGHPDVANAYANKVDNRGKITKKAAIAAVAKASSNR